MKKVLPFSWYGGKFIHLDWLLPFLVYTQTFVDLYGGSAAVVLNKAPSPVDVYNDIDGSLVSFFQVLRDEPDKLIRLIQLTPYSRLEYEKSLLERTDLTPLEEARRFYVRACQTYTGASQTATPGNWQYSIGVSRRGRAQSVSQWQNKPIDLEAIAKRLLRIQIECKPALDIIDRYDTSDTLFYCDPPYPMESRSGGVGYAHEMTVEDHEDLAGALHECKGAVVLSGYECDLMDRLYSDWQTTHSKEYLAQSTGREARIESLWFNDKAVQLNGLSKQLTLF